MASPHPQHQPSQGLTQQGPPLSCLLGFSPYLCGMIWWEKELCSRIASKTNSGSHPILSSPSEKITRDVSPLFLCPTSLSVLKHASRSSCKNYPCQGQQSPAQCQTPSLSVPCVSAKLTVAWEAQGLATCSPWLSYILFCSSALQPPT